ncbi:MAG TPA: NAD(P)-dependent oxidoreductase [Vicinamibacterales bacterium]|nr:NAD(P)-dependent oxidoreductase [Vicinamibacterales bacterium]
MMRIAVFGASGFVGATLVERLWRAGDAEVVPVIHSSGNAARLARFGKPLVTADALQPDTLDRALDGCSHVVNCSRGPAEVMVRGLRNMLDASRRAKVQQFVHLSSVAAYGDLEVTMLEESAEPRPARNTYGWTKNAQDQLVQRAADGGLRCAVLCPPNISGSYSAFLMEVVQSIRRSELALVEDGSYPVELVDVENLVHAIRLALRAPEIDGRRIFVTDGRPRTWADLAAALAPLADANGPLPSIGLDVARQLSAEPAAAPASLIRTFKHFCSADVRNALKKDPLIASADKSVKGMIRRVAPLERALRRRFEERAPIKRVARGPRVSERLIRQQLRNIRYSQTRARDVLGYEPLITPEQSMNAFRAWYSELHGWQDAAWPLSRHLYQ